VLNRTGVPGGLSRKQVEEALKMKVDVAIPDLPRAVGNAATLGEPVMVSSTGFRHGIVEIVRQVASIRLLDGGQDGSLPTAGQGKRGLFARLRRK
jgi:pilus assembly protein CpaE